MRSFETSAVLGQRQTFAFIWEALKAVVCKGNQSTTLPSEPSHKVFGICSRRRAVAAYTGVCSLNNLPASASTCQIIPRAEVQPLNKGASCCLVWFVMNVWIVIILNVKEICLPLSGWQAKEESFCLTCKSVSKTKYILLPFHPVNFPVAKQINHVQSTSNNEEERQSIGSSGVVVLVGLGNSGQIPTCLTYHSKL